ncbi:hypothetical protein DFH29DRAFT_983327 [Suillus ampliporus]|nr:hypothetical protein DFH29DRAFT_983327 [Suillus ampliporus]
MDTGIYPPVVQPLGMTRPRRSSSISYSPRPPTFSDPFRRHSGMVKFKRKGAFRTGITLGEAQANVRLAGWDSYSFNDLGVDHRGKIYVKIAWPGYSPLNYEIPVDGYGGRIDLQSLARRIGRAVAHYLQLPLGTFTILAAIGLTSSDPSTQPKIIALATGCKCLPKDKLPLQGEALHDSHAEVLARRCRHSGKASGGSYSTWISEAADGRYRLKDDVQMTMYISTPPLVRSTSILYSARGDASMRFLAIFQDEEMAALKDSSVFVPLPPNIPSRGRDNYSLFGVLRTKPGRADSPQTLSLSCSDKIARWNVLGIQGALGSGLFHPIYLTKIIIGEVPQDLHDVVKSDCERAFWGRLQDISGLPEGYTLSRPEIQFTSVVFVHSRSAQEHSSSARRSCNEFGLTSALTWVADSPSPHEVLINGLKRGVPPKHRYKTMFWTQDNERAITNTHNLLLLSKTITYYQAKERMTQYQTAKNCLLGEGQPFSGWIRSGARWENFDSSSDNGQQKSDITN